MNYTGAVCKNENEAKFLAAVAVACGYVPKESFLYNLHYQTFCVGNFGEGVFSFIGNSSATALNTNKIEVEAMASYLVKNRIIKEEIESFVNAKGNTIKVSSKGYVTFDCTTVDEETVNKIIEIRAKLVK